ncbi:MAG: YchJ family metal-binding protein [Desulfobulbus sp.]|jgi:SEC-C motif-containing protein|nr:YchJ family metal-binding protein [Desulfobulbus sp.]
MASDTTETAQACPCGSGRAYDVCCEPVLSGRTPAATAKALMRSRYTAFVQGHTAHLLRSWHPSTRPATLDADDQPVWQGLTLLRVEAGGLDDDHGIVEFLAIGLTKCRPVHLHEVSRFIREMGQWFYLAGETRPADRDTTGIKTGRNDPCPCGSSRKYKKCCGQ